MKPASLIPELYCSDFAVSLRFYAEVLGYTVDYDRPEDRFALLDRSGAQLMIEQTRDPERRLVSAELEHPFGRGVNLQIMVEDVDALYVAVVAADAPVFLPLEEREYRRGRGSVTVRQFVTRDPDGYLLRLSQEMKDRAK